VDRDGAVARNGLIRAQASQVPTVAVTTSSMG
jgi:hypothetical protein